MKPKNTKILVCPMCFGSRIDLYIGGYAGKIYKCLECGYTGPIILEIELEDYVKILEKKNLRRIS